MTKDPSVLFFSPRRGEFDACYEAIAGQHENNQEHFPIYIYIIYIYVQRRSTLTGSNFDFI